VRIDARAAERRLLELELEAVARQRLQRLHRLRDDFRPDAVTGQYRSSSAVRNED